MTVKNIIFFPNGNYAAFDAEGEQVDEEQHCAWLDVLQQKLDRGVIDEKTVVKMPGWYTPDHEHEKWTVGELVGIGRLKVPK